MDIAELGFRIDPSGVTQATSGLKKLTAETGRTERATEKLERQAVSLGKAWGTAIGLVSSAAIAGVTRAYLRQADAFAEMSAKLRLVTGSTKAATSAQRDLFALAQETSSDLGATAELYTKLGSASTDLARDHERLLGITEMVSKALVISGADAAASASVIRQFSQALGSGALRGDEFISVMEGAPRLARALADGLGVPIGALRDLAAEGDLTTEKIIAALERQGEVLDREFGAMPVTVGRATTQVRNAIAQMIGEVDQASGASADMAQSIMELARALESPEVRSGFATIVSAIASVTSAMLEGIGTSMQYQRQLQKASTLGGGQMLEGLSKGWSALLSGDLQGARAGGNQARAGMSRWLFGSDDFDSVDGGSSSVDTGPFANVVGSARGPQAKLIEQEEKAIRKRSKATAEATAADEAWEKEWADMLALQEDAADSLRDYTNQHLQAAIDKEDARERERQQLQGFIEDLEFEGELIRMSNTDREVAIALRYANADAASTEGKRIAELIREQERERDAMQFQVEAMDGVRGSWRGLFHDLRAGEGIVGSLENAFNSLMESLFDASVNHITDSLFGKQGDSGGGAWGDLLGSFFGGSGSGNGDAGSIMDLFSGDWGFARGGYTGRGGRYDPAGIVHRGEYVVNADATRALGLPFLNQLNAGRSAPIESEQRTGGDTYNSVAISVEGQVDRRTRSQIASDVQQQIVQAGRNR